MGSEMCIRDRWGGDGHAMIVAAASRRIECVSVFDMGFALYFDFLFARMEDW